LDVSNKSIASIEVWPNDIVRPFSDGTSTYVPGKIPTHFEHYARNDGRALEGERLLSYPGVNPKRVQG